MADILQLLILCYQLAVALACPLDHHLYLPSPGPADATCAGNWTPLLKDCLSPVHTTCRGAQHHRKKMCSLCQMLLSGSN